MYCIKIEESDKPITAAKVQKSIWTVDSFILFIPTLSAIIKPSGASIIINARGDAYKVAPKLVSVLV